MPPLLSSLTAKLHAAQCCDADDVRRLRLLLTPDKPPTRPAGPGHGHSRKNSTVSESRSSRAPSTTSRAGSKTSQAVSSRAPAARPAARSAKADHEVDACSPPQRNQLATDAVNHSLRLLSAAASKPLASASIDSRDSQARVLAQSPTTSRQRTVQFQDQQAPASFSRDQLSITADVGHLAFDYLRSPEGRRQNPSAAALAQLQSGLVAFAGKLIGLGFSDVALRELVALKKLLQAALVQSAPDGASRPQSARANGSPTDDRETVASLLSFDAVDPADTQLLETVVSHQLTVLRLMAATPRMATLNTAMQTLDPSCDASPVNLLVRLYELNPKQPKTLLQLESLSQIIAHTASRIAQAEAVDFAKSGLVLKMLALALRIRLVWFGLCGHEYSYSKEIMSPFTKAVSRFAKCPAPDPLQKYKLARKLHQDLVRESNELLQDDEKALAPSNELVLCLSRMAQDAGLFNEAQELASVLTGKCNETGKASATEFIEVARLATFALAHEDQSSATKLTRAAELLSNGLDQETSAMEAVLREAIKLRNAAYAFIKKALSSSSSSSKLRDMAPPEHFALAYKLLLSFLMLLAQNLARDETRNEPASHDQGLVITLHVLKASLEATLNVTKQLLSSRQIAVELLLQAIALCKYLLEKCTELDQEILDKNLSCEEQGLFQAEMARMSWNIAAVADGGPDGAHKAIAAVKQGLALLNCAEPEVRRAGNEPFGFHRLGRALLRLKRPKEAKQAFADAITSCIATGVVESAAESSNHCPLRLLLRDNSQVQILHACLKSHLDLHFGESETDDFDDFSATLHSASEKLVLWELWFVIVSGWATKPSPCFKVLDASAEIARQLLALYKLPEYPMRRMRLLYRLLRLRGERRELKQLVQFEDVEKILHFTGSLAQDEGLAGYYDHNKAFLSVSLGILRGPHGVQFIENALEIWTDLIKSAASWEDVEARIDEPEPWMAQLGAVADFMDMQGLEEHRAHALALLASAEALSNDGNLVRRPPRTVDVAQYLSQLGYTNEAGRYLDVGNILMGIAAAEGNPHASLVRASWSLTRGDMEKSEEILSALRKSIGSAEERPKMLKLFDVARGLPSQMRQAIAFCDILLLYAELSLQTEGTAGALLYSRRAVLLLDRIWKSVEAQQKDVTNGAPAPKDDLDDLVQHLSRLSVARKSDLTVASGRDAELRGTPFWPLAGRLFRALMQLSRISKHHGIQSSATAAADQAYAIAKAVKSRRYIARSLLERGDIAWRRGDLDEAKQLFDSARALYAKFPKPSRDQLALHCFYGNFHRIREDWAKEELAYTRALASIKELKSPDWLSEIQELPPLSVPNVDTASPSFEHLSDDDVMDTYSPAKSAKQWIEQQSIPKLEVGRLTPVPIRRPPTASDILSDPFTSLEDEIHYRRAESLLLQGELAACSDMLSQHARGEGSAEAVAKESILQALHQLQEALAELSSHAVFSILPEATLSLPAVPVEKTLKSISPLSSPIKIKAIVAGHARSVSKATNVGQLSTMQALQKLVSSLSESSGLKLSLCSNTTIARLQEVLTSSSMLMSVAGQSQVGQHPAALAYNLELAKSFATIREQAALEVELAIKNMTSNLDWPDEVQEAAVIKDRTMRSPELDLTNTLPASWSVISLNLREAEGYLFITKYRADRVPFILRLPLNRQPGDDLEEEEPFSFADAKQELRNILEASDASVHLARDNPEELKVKGRKSQWWEEREALDARLGNLLANIENLWLGGFRGVLSKAPADTDACVQFRARFEGILGKHLPSRQTKRGTKATPIKLDDNILELFLGLASQRPLDEEHDLEEALTDLLYFVVDVLQFNGETNAYDEIDFDAVIVEVQEALQDAGNNIGKSVRKSAPRDHLILVLDKNLHDIPWESMPCLADRSVSRLGSLIELRDRLALMNRQQQGSYDGVLINRLSGTYMLNPSGDLPATQARFEKPLYTLASNQSWTKVVNRVPSEAEFSSALTQGVTSNHPNSRHALVYIGHGSGAQFIRGKSIQRLRRQGCNAALLFGCSSALLKDAGEFEPHGTPKHYLLAGAPAVLGGLWDVTDGDLDKFAATTLEGWGLLARGTFQADEAGRPRKGKPASRQEQQTGRSASAGSVLAHAPAEMSLTDAVALARKSCYLKFLNGAAMVVYGVPVYLDSVAS